MAATYVQAAIPCEPQLQPGVNYGPLQGYSVVPTTTYTQLDATGKDCFGVLVQSGGFNDSNAAATTGATPGIIGIRLGSATSPVGYTLNQLGGSEQFIPCTNTNQIYHGLTATANPTNISLRFVVYSVSRHE